MERKAANRPNGHREVAPVAMKLAKLNYVVGLRSKIVWLKMRYSCGGIGLNAGPSLKRLVKTRRLRLIVELELVNCAMLQNVTLT